MKVDFTSYDSGWFDLAIGMTELEIDMLIANLTKLKSDPDQRFHLAGDHTGKASLGDIEFYREDTPEKHNMLLTGAAIKPNR